MRGAIPLLRATHPEATVVVTAAMAALGAAAGMGWRLALLVAAVLAGQCSIGWCNDWLDRHRDRAAGRQDKPLVTGVVAERTVLLAALTALALCAVLSLALGAAAAALHLLGVAMGWAYNLYFKFTPLSVLPYAVAFGALPLVVAFAAGTLRAPPWLVAAAACLGAGAHFVQVVPDLATDAAQGVAGLPQRLGLRAALVTGALLLGAAAAVTVVGHGHLRRPPFAAGLLVVEVAVVAVVVAGLRGRARQGFRLTLLVALATVLLLLAGGSPFS